MSIKGYFFDRKCPFVDGIDMFQQYVDKIEKYRQVGKTCRFRRLDPQNVSKNLGFIDRFGHPVEAADSLGKRVPSDDGNRKKVDTSSFYRQLFATCRPDRRLRGSLAGRREAMDSKQTMPKRTTCPDVVAIDAGRSVGVECRVRPVDTISQHVDTPALYRQVRSTCRSRRQIPGRCRCRAPGQQEPASTVDRVGRPRVGIMVPTGARRRGRPIALRVPRLRPGRSGHTTAQFSKLY